MSNREEREKVKVGVVGCGAAGLRIHWPRFLKHGCLYQLVAWADLVREKAEKAALETGVGRALSVEELIEDKQVELVVVATKPPVTHRDIAVKALQSGKHVVVEKPMATNSEECEEMIRTAEKAGRILSVHHNRRWDVDFLAVREIISSGAVGELRLVRNEFLAGYLGCCYDWAIHLIDQTMVLNQNRKFVEVTATFCQPGCSRTDENQGFFSARLRSESGIIYDVGMLPPVNGSALRPGKAPIRFLIAGTEGVAYIDWCQRPEDAFSKFISYHSLEPQKNLGDLKSIESELAVEDFYQLLFSAIREEKPNPVSAKEGQRAVRAWELICQSALENRCLSIDL
ncbi:MAG: Gfo/Idh/MocA family oxidoreductase [Candidatus Omnitrophica bacterium]|nr:Gfo/Idh/MocA family oxidoreductase [Candidatus Omnitrophota bacterium]